MIEKPFGDLEETRGIPVPLSIATEKVFDVAILDELLKLNTDTLDRATLEKFLKDNHFEISRREIDRICIKLDKIKAGLIKLRDLLPTDPSLD